VRAAKVEGDREDERCVHAFTAAKRSGSWPPTLLAISQITNQMKVTARLRGEISKRAASRG
jgi:hypothetical protein